MPETGNQLKQAAELLARCEAGFSAFVMGRKLARKERDKLRADISDWLAKNANKQATP